MQPQAKRSTARGQQPVGGWTASQTKAWEKEQQKSKEALEDMDERVQKAVQEFSIRDPAAVSKKTEEAIKSMGVRPDKKLVARQAGGTGGGIPLGEPEDGQRLRSWNPA
jgi:hypothetical protein